MSKLQVAIIGRPNVGKSTLFNQLTGSRRAVVKDEPGVTRDIQQGNVHWCGVDFYAYDTAGISSGNEKAWTKASRDMALQAASKADKIVFIVDGKFGVHPEDHELAKHLKILGKPVLLCVNKVDDKSEADMLLADFFRLGIDEMIPLSSEHKFGLDVILDWIIRGIEKTPPEDLENTIRVSIIGKPNAGKSTLVNRILGEQKVIVSPVAGTTVDSIELPFERNGQKFILIDTAGIRRQSKRVDLVEYVSAKKSEESIEMADIIVLLIDGLLGPTQQDARLVEMALEAHKAVIVTINKVDVAEKKIDKFRETMRTRVSREFHFFADIPVAYVSAKTGRGVEELFESIETLWKKLTLKISTRDINDFFKQVIRLAPAPIFQNKDVKFYYITQTKQRPPSFMTFVNEPKGLTNSYKRFVAAQIKKHYGLQGIPIRVYAKKRARSRSHNNVTYYDMEQEQE